MCGQVFGFKVLESGRMSPGFKKGLKRLAERGYCDPDCVVVKSAPGPSSGITHWGGRYVGPGNPCAREVMEAMRAQGIPPPSPPFIVAPGECTLYHEWGHHVDHVRSGDDQGALFSFRWFSHFYELGIRRRSRWGASSSSDEAIPLSREACAAVSPIWWHSASELFANLFEEWMRGGKALAWDICDPDYVLASRDDHSIFQVSLLSGVESEDVRARTFQVFEGGLRPAGASLEVREDFFGTHTAETVGMLRKCFAELGSLAEDRQR